MLSPSRVEAIQALQIAQMEMKRPIYTPPADTSAKKIRASFAETTETALGLLAGKAAAMEGGLRVAFLHWDKAQRGQLNMLDLAAVLGIYGVDLNSEELRGLVARMDRDGDGRVD